MEVGGNKYKAGESGFNICEEKYKIMEGTLEPSEGDQAYISHTVWSLEWSGVEGTQHNISCVLCVIMTGLLDLYSKPFLQIFSALYLLFIFLLFIRTS